MRTITKLLLTIATVITMLITVLFLQSCGKQSNQIVGKWRSDKDQTELEFFSDGTFKGFFNQKISSGRTMESNIVGFKIDLAFQLFKWSKDIAETTLVRKSVGKEPQKAILQFLPSADTLYPWTKVPFCTDDTGNITIMANVNGKKVEGWKTNANSSFSLVAKVDDESYPVDSCSYVAKYLDTALYWNGDLCVKGTYNMIAESSFEICIPLTNHQTHIDLIVCQVFVRENQLTVKNLQLDIRDDSYTKLTPDVSLDKSTTIANICDPINLYGVAIGDRSEDIFINTGVTIGRLQNAAFRLPCLDSFGPIKPTDLKLEDNPILLIKGGIEPMKGYVGCFQYAHVEQGQTLTVGAKLR